MAKHMTFEATEFTCVYDDIGIVVQKQGNIWASEARMMDQDRQIIIGHDFKNSTVAIQASKEFILKFEDLVERFTSMPKIWFSEGHVK